MRVYQLKSTQKIPASLNNAWHFFANAKNLSLITPAHLSLKFTNDIFGEEMYPGQIITYRVRPILNIPIFWMTEITIVEPLKFFIDEQRRGPYKLWQHQHYFKSVDGGVEMTDIVNYEIPLGFLGVFAHRLIVRKTLQSIFEFRYSRVTEIFGEWPGEKIQLVFS